MRHSGLAFVKLHETPNENEKGKYQSPKGYHQVKHYRGRKSIELTPKTANTRLMKDVPVETITATAIDELRIRQGQVFGRDSLHEV